MNVVQSEKVPGVSTGNVYSHPVLRFLTRIRPPRGERLLTCERESRQQIRLANELSSTDSKQRAGDAESLEAEGLGGFASGTVNGIKTRRYHAPFLRRDQGTEIRPKLFKHIDAHRLAGSISGGAGATQSLGLLLSCGSVLKSESTETGTDAV
jgi:hypothetical protein